jgi:hypothetical protein
MAVEVDGDIVSCALLLYSTFRACANHTCSHLPDNKGVNYQVFLRALYNFAKVEMRLGR